MLKPTGPRKFKVVSGSDKSSPSDKSAKFSPQKEMDPLEKLLLGIPDAAQYL